MIHSGSTELILFLNVYKTFTALTVQEGQAGKMQNKLGNTPLQCTTLYITTHHMCTWHTVIAVKTTTISVWVGTYLITNKKNNCSIYMYLVWQLFLSLLFFLIARSNNMFCSFLYRTWFIYLFCFAFLPDLNLHAVFLYLQGVSQKSEFFLKI